MNENDILRETFNDRQLCVIIPTYNNAGTLPAVIADVAGYTKNIIVVNDGSSDNTETVVSSFSFITYIGYSKNVGKGWALRKGFEKAIALGFDYAITIDSDGQHFAKDIPVFIEKLKTSPGGIIIGSRNLNQENMPGKNTFGNKFSNFWFKIETGINMPDTQSGYRLYPVQHFKHTRFFTTKYEFEIEVLVRAAWKGLEITPVPISVYYAPAGERITHFRPFKDFFRIGVLNTILVLIAFLYIKPRNFFRSLFKRESREAFVRDHLINVNEPDHIKALSVALGVFMGIVPIWGFQLVTAIFLAIVLRLNKALVIIAANISIPPMIPLIVFLSYKTGAIWMANGSGDLLFTRDLSFDSVKNNFQQYIYGSITLAVAAAVAGGVITWILLSVFKKKASTVV
ncbi:DUF2062 domain-containing protein [Terrimonas sp.]|uniref:DUF2062 domain-containing protein n=1 Tax=Terrimonas sp. TaxID=1914338 RepID=UPI000D51EF54|nr:DUF2062 domain-containing protein [Terrimonas sp.]PVD51266.1 DUF2062 domain-containing protein [Terrimonas sp.]